MYLKERVITRIFWLYTNYTFNMKHEVCNKFNFKRSVILIVLFIVSKYSYGLDVNKSIMQQFLIGYKVVFPIQIDCNNGNNERHFG